MEAKSLEFLKNLLHSPAPSGYERPIQEVVRAYVKEFADEVKTDLHGNVIAAVNPGAKRRVMFAGHCDQIGLLVQHIDDDGYLWANLIGGWDIQMLLGQNMQVHTDSGPIHGVIARKAIHLLTPEERKTVPEIKDLWIDIGARNGAEAREKVAIGDPITFELGFRPMLNQLASAPGMDNRVGVWVVMEALRQASEKSPEFGVFSVSTVQEEIGLRGAQTSAYSIQPEVGIAVDVTHATDCPAVSKKENGEINVGDGPVVYRGPNVNPVVFSTLTDLAEKNDISCQINSISRPAGNDANAMQLNQGGMATGIVAIPNRYMHSPVEVVSLEDLEHAANLLAAFCLEINEQTDFTP
ncbi:M42 family metallopeptidase [Gimesia benthica]|uniref:M42 family metallopeptidase n=1 Tax=Gimesia benthica TaxID=2608982 RepID=A0A6I6AES6_9PLAN|nr:M42 family metallopeptidase [Gimesia benthica]QGQ25114.1 M42 family metallopeptidase [Gimesia benthica]